MQYRIIIPFVIKWLIGSFVKSRISGNGPFYFLMCAALVIGIFFFLMSSMTSLTSTSVHLLITHVKVVIEEGFSGIFLFSSDKKFHLWSKIFRHESSEESMLIIFVSSQRYRMSCLYRKPISLYSLWENRTLGQSQRLMKTPISAK